MGISAIAALLMLVLLVVYLTIFVWAFDKENRRLKKENSLLRDRIEVFGSNLRDEEFGRDSEILNEKVLPPDSSQLDVFSLAVKSNRFRILLKFAICAGKGKLLSNEDMSHILENHNLVATGSDISLFIGRLMAVGVLDEKHRVIMSREKYEEVCGSILGWKPLLIGHA